MPSVTFKPKSGAKPWVANVDAASEGNGYDITLMLDKVASTPTSGWMLELAIDEDGSIAGQITARPGHDALAVINCTPDTLYVTDNSGGPVHAITDAMGPSASQTITAAVLMAAVREAVHAARAIDDRLDDPHGDGSGRDAQAPDGDNYNQLWDAISTLFHLVPRAESVR